MKQACTDSDNDNNIISYYDVWLVLLCKQNRSRIEAYAEFGVDITGNW